MSFKGCHSTKRRVRTGYRIPVETIKKYCVDVREVLYLYQIVINTIWEKEAVPEGLVKAKFTMIFQKGPVNDAGNFRCIALLNH